MKFDIVRAWKDESYRQSLSEEELAMLPESPVGGFELTESDLAAVQGAGSKGAAPISYGGLPICIVSSVLAVCISNSAPCDAG